MNTRYQIYVRDTFHLVGTMGICFDHCALAVNKGIQIQDPSYSIPDSSLDDRASWKYYQNMAGLRHETDPPISILSLQTGELIEFSKKSFRDDPITKAAYRRGTIPYYELIGAYPEMIEYIHGVIYAPDPKWSFFTVSDGEIVDTTDYLSYPLEIAKKPNGTILYFDSNYVEENEYHLIFEMQNWIYDYLHRWAVWPYAVIDDLYVADVVAKLAILLVPYIINARLRRCKTNEVHSFHIKQYLGSKGIPEIYLDVLDKKQSLFLYRNLDYIRTHAGKRDVMLWLIENIMTARGLPVSQYVLKHLLSDFRYDESLKDHVSLTPTPFLQKKPIGTPDEVFVNVGYTHEAILEKMNQRAPGNPRLHVNEFESLDRSLYESSANTLQTKVLESRSDDAQTTTPYELEEVAINEWLRLSISGDYGIKATISVPNTKNEISLTSREAAFLFGYCMIKLHRGVQMDQFGQPYPWSSYFDVNEDGTLCDPSFLVSRVLKKEPPTLEYLKTQVQEKTLSDSELSLSISDYPVLTSVRTTQELINWSKKVHSFACRQRMLGAQFYAPMRYGMFTLACTKSWRDELISLPGFHSWREVSGISLENCSVETLTNLMASLLAIFGGYNSDEVNEMKKVQKAMIAIMQRLLSYSVQFISDEGTTDNLVLDQRPHRYGPGKLRSQLRCGIPLSADVVRASVSTAINARAVWNDYNQNKPDCVARATILVDYGTLYRRAHGREIRTNVMKSTKNIVIRSKIPQIEFVGNNI
jgi:hypothetical protein